MATAGGGDRGAGPRPAGGPDGRSGTRPGRGVPGRGGSGRGGPEGNGPGRGGPGRGGPGRGGPAGRGPGREGPGGSGKSGGPGDGSGRRKGGEGKRRGWRRFIPNWKIVMAGFAVCAAGVFGMVAVGYAYTPIPSVTQENVEDEGSVIYYDDGKTVLARLGTKREIVEYEDIPVEVQDAVVAAENHTFWEDPGIDIRGMARAAWSTLTGQQVQGGSTITQQMVRNYYGGLSQEVSIERKVKEIFISVKLAKTRPKEEVLTRYLNTIYFGRGAHGIQAAAKEFFGKRVQDLNIREAAYLAGRIQNPSRFDREEQEGNLAPTQERYEYVIRELAEMKPDKYGSLPQTHPKAPKRKPVRNTEVYKGLKGYMITEVLKELEKKGISEEEVKEGGYKITSTFNKRLMLLAKKAVVENTADLPKEIHTGLAAVDPRNGRLRAFYGGNNYLKDAWNEATMSQKQAASAFKPYVLAAWLDSGYSLDSYLPGNGSVKLPGTTPITNDHPGPASVDVVKATAASINTAYAKMAEKVGLDKVIEVAAGAGLDRERLKDAESRHHYLISIGSNQVTMVEQAAGYSIFANKGKHYETHTVIKVVDRNGLVVIKEPSTAKQVISEEAAADATYALQQVVKSGTGRGAALYDRPVAGKTGTNNQNKEAWFVGFTPQLSTAVGMYKEVDGKEVSLGNIQGATYPTKVWRAFMSEALKNAPVLQFPERANVGTPEHIAPKPTPTPTATPEDEELPEEDDSGDDPGDEWPVEDEQETPVEEEQESDCFPWDDSCDTNLDAEFDAPPAFSTPRGREPVGR